MSNSTDSKRAVGTPRTSSVLSVRAERLLLPIGLGIAVLILYVALTTAGVLRSSYFPPVDQLFRGVAEAISSGSTWSAIGATALNWLAATVIAVGGGSAVGVLIGSQAWLRELLYPVVQVLRATPPVALIPLLVVTLGTGGGSAIFLASFGGFWFALVNAIDGVLRTDVVARDTARMFQFGKRRELTWVLLPSALPYIMTGFKLASTICLILVVTSEILIGTPGIGQLVSLARTADDPPRMYGFIFLVGLMGLAVNHLATWIENIALRNYPTQHSKDGVR